MPEEKKPRRRKPAGVKAITTKPHGERLDALIKGLMDWHVLKVNGEPEAERFDLLLATEGPEGGVSCKYVLGDFEASKARMKSDLESAYLGSDMYAYSYKGRWQTKEGGVFGGAIVVVESLELQPTVVGYELSAGDDGRAAAVGSMHRLGLADWSLFHRSKA